MGQWYSRRNLKVWKNENTSSGLVFKNLQGLSYRIRVKEALSILMLCAPFNRRRPFSYLSVFSRFFKILPQAPCTSH